MNSVIIVSNYYGYYFCHYYCCLSVSQGKMPAIIWFSLLIACLQDGWCVEMGVVFFIVYCYILTSNLLQVDFASVPSTKLPATLVSVDILVMPELLLLLLLTLFLSDFPRAISNRPGQWLGKSETHIAHRWCQGVTCLQLRSRTMFSSFVDCLSQFEDWPCPKMEPLIWQVLHTAYSVLATEGKPLRGFMFW